MNIRSSINEYVEPIRKLKYPILVCDDFGNIYLKYRKNRGICLYSKDYPEIVYNHLGILEYITQQFKGILTIEVPDYPTVNNFYPHVGQLKGSKDLYVLFIKKNCGLAIDNQDFDSKSYLYRKPCEYRTDWIDDSFKTCKNVKFELKNDLEYGVIGKKINIKVKK